MITAKKILIIGSAGSGKTTFAIKLSEIINLPIIHLDKEYWLPNWEKPDHNEWVKKVDSLLNQECFIMDGNYRSTMEQRLNRADMVIFLDYKRGTCVRSAFKRMIKNKKKQRFDLADGCIEKIDFSFLKWVWDFPKKYRPEIVEKLNKLKIPVVIFKSRKESEIFLNKLKNENEM